MVGVFRGRGPNLSSRGCELSGRSLQPREALGALAKSTVLDLPWDARFRHGALSVWDVIPFSSTNTFTFDTDFSAVSVLLLNNKAGMWPVRRRYLACSRGFLNILKGRRLNSYLINIINSILNGLN